MFTDNQYLQYLYDFQIIRIFLELMKSMVQCLSPSFVKILRKWLFLVTQKKTQKAELTNINIALSSAQPRFI